MLGVAFIWPRCSFIEKLPNIEILQILNEYRKIFQGSNSADLLEISKVSHSVLSLQYLA